MKLDVEIADNDYSTSIDVAFSTEEQQLIEDKIATWVRAKERLPEIFGFELMLDLSLEKPFSLVSQEFVTVKRYERGKPLRIIISFYPKKYNTREKREARARSLIGEHVAKCLDELRKLK